MKWIRIIVFMDNKAGEWLCRILISLNIIMPAFNFSDHFYPLVPLAITMIAFWLFVVRIKGVAVLLLLLAFWMNYSHIGQPFHE